MEFLKAILGEELYNQVASKINEHNGNEANKDNQIKIGNLGSGDYVGKAKHEALLEQLKGKDTELTTANGLIAELQKGTKGNKELQDAIDTYKNVTVPELQKQLAETKLNSALKVALLAENVLDVPYVTFKLNEKMREQGKTLELDENENIKGWDDVLSGLKTQLPQQFGKTAQRKVEPFKLTDPQPKDDGLTKDQFNKMGYSSRVKLKAENPELYDAMTKG